ncbi:MAG TPA: thioredoxin family protein [Candidatus Krumholzibacteria bacterium]|nr:thioredoxin family protein [Candidatus Krumholzibacteria bacterium]HPD70621.1 thioredoxin family protein [Candidatus Krumholzibacteria bacterium]HRY39679.1 thioredoxin family protein [Candidatus Krumholzibacteria bacterium]
MAGALAVAVIAAFALRGGGKDEAVETAPTPAGVQAALPRLVDLGADKCVPCKMMAPILVELRSEYEGRFEVVFIDVWKDQTKGQEYGIRVIPTQIFFGADGRELMRHEGFFAKEDILAAWRAHGYDFPAPAAAKTES